MPLLKPDISPIRTMFVESKNCFSQPIMTTMTINIKVKLFDQMFLFGIYQGMMDFCRDHQKHGLLSVVE